MTHRYQSGFTLYELLITLVVIGIVLTIGIPNFGAFTQNSRITATANDLHSSFYLGRSEAARSKSIITICTSDDSMGAATCSGVGNTFDDGWIIFIDLDGNIDRDIDPAAGENVLRRHPAIDDAIDILTNGATFFSFAPTGLGRGDTGGQISLVTAVICDGRGNEPAAGGYSAARVVVVTPLGRATVLRDKALITAHGGC